MAVNLSNSTPAAPDALHVNVAWQQDGSGNVSGNVPASLAEVAKVDLTAQGANIAATTLLALTASGRYRVMAYIIVSQVATSSSTLPKITLTWTDPDNNTAQSLDITATSGGNLLTTFAQASTVISAKTGTNIQYATSGYATSGATPMQYALHLVLEQVQ